MGDKAGNLVMESGHGVPWMPCKGTWTLLASNGVLLKVFE